MFLWIAGFLFIWGDLFVDASIFIFSKKTYSVFSSMMYIPSNTTKIIPSRIWMIPQYIEIICDSVLIPRIITICVHACLTPAAH